MKGHSARSTFAWRSSVLLSQPKHNITFIFCGIEATRAIYSWKAKLYLLTDCGPTLGACGSLPSIGSHHKRVRRFNFLRGITISQSYCVRYDEAVANRTDLIHKCRAASTQVLNQTRIREVATHASSGKLASPGSVISRPPCLTSKCTMATVLWNRVKNILIRNRCQ